MGKTRHGATRARQILGFQSVNERPDRGTRGLGRREKQNGLGCLTQMVT